MASLKQKYWIYSLLWMGVIFAGSSFPIAPNMVTSIKYSDKVAHFFEYGILGVFVYNALKNTFRQIENRFIIVVMTSVFTFLYGVSDEVHQLFVPNREFSVYDMLADAVGGFTFSLICRIRDLKHCKK